MAEAGVKAAKTDAPAKLGIRRAAVFGVAAFAAVALLAEPFTATAFAQTGSKPSVVQPSGATVELAKSWLSKQSGAKLADISADISLGLSKIGLNKLSDKAKIVNAGTEDKDRVFFVTDAGANGVLKVVVSPKNTASFDGMSHPKITVSSGFSLAAGSNSIAVLVSGSKVIVFEFGGRIVPDFARNVPESNPQNLQAGAGVANGRLCIAVTADNFNNIYVLDYTQYTIDKTVPIQIFSKEPK